MRFRIGSHLLVADVAQEESFVSPRTGATLRRLVIAFEADDDPTHEEYLDLLDAARNSPSPREHGLASEAEEGHLSAVWRIADAEFGPAPGGSASAWQHRWVLEEEEAVDPSQDASAPQAEAEAGTLPGARQGFETSREEGIAVVRRFVHLLNEGNVEALAALVADDFRCHVAGGLAGDARGPEVWRRRAGALRTAFPDYRITIEDLLSDADKVILRYRGQGTHRGPLFGAEPTGAPVTYTGIMIVRISDGKLADEWTEFDQFGLLRQIGALPTGA